VRLQSFWSSERQQAVMRLAEKKKAARQLVDQVGQVSNVELSRK